jgi:hypothetical protein
VLREKNIQTKSIVRSQNQIVVTLNDPAQSDEAVTQLKTLGNTIATGISAGQSDLIGHDQRQQHHRRLLGRRYRQQCRFGRSAEP